ncbi:MAG TPA: hypothetical protein VMM18_15620 [Gemmatimonadaceae bacterium]|nr:hypothetical protein [Gemmatimonadaceae bacterium]
MSDSERPDVLAFRELEQLIRHLGDELGSFRRRALQAEARLRERESADGSSHPAAETRLAELENENEALRSRLAAARSRTAAMLARMRFLRQQHDRASER